MSVNAPAAGDSAERFPTGRVRGPESRQDRTRRGAGPAAAGRLSVVARKRFEVPLQASRRGRQSLALAAAGGAGALRRSESEGRAAGAGGSPRQWRWQRRCLAGETRGGAGRVCACACVPQVLGHGLSLQGAATEPGRTLPSQMVVPRARQQPAMLCCMPGVAFVPALLVSWSSAAFITSYVIAVLAGHVEPLVPYISDTGTKPPESGIFGFMINISALLGAITMCIRYLLIEKQNESSHFIRSSCNVFSLCIGLMGCTGMGIVATFQELSVPSVHDIGALVAFGSGVVYITLQSIISYKSCPQWNTYLVCHIRMAISVISCIAFIPMIVFASKISVTKIDWTPDEKDYTYHVVSAVCEWMVAFGFVFFFLTFIRDFQRVSLRISTEIHEDS